eukprot:2884087-Amphidinium_carterae.1
MPVIVAVATVQHHCCSGGGLCLVIAAVWVGSSLCQALRLIKRQSSSKTAHYIASNSTLNNWNCNDTTHHTYQET